MIKQYISFLVFIISVYCGYSQKVVYSKDFNYYTLEPVNPISNLDAVNFFVSAVYDDSNLLVKVTATERKLNRPSYPYGTFSIINKNGKRIMFLGAGKERQGYTRAIFQKKLYQTDSAFSIHDTLLFKETSKYSYEVQIYIKQTENSYLFKEMSFIRNEDLKTKLQPLASFDSYKAWFCLDSCARKIVGGVIKTDSDPIIEFINVKSDVFFNRINITRESLKTLSDNIRPSTLFWLKMSGLLY